MSKNLMKFSFEGSHEVRVGINKLGEPHVVAKDVAECLGYVWKGVSGTISHVPEEWRGVCSVQTPSGIQDMVTLSAQGLYFFLARSDKPKALPFQKWLAGEVLPSIQKTGSYSVKPTPQEQPSFLLMEPRPEYGNLYRLNSLHELAGGTSKDKLSPDHWKDNVDSQMELLALQERFPGQQPLISKKGKREKGGTFGNLAMVLSYSKWISLNLTRPEFYRRVFKASVGTPPGVPLRIPTQPEATESSEEKYLESLKLAEHHQKLADQHRAEAMDFLHEQRVVAQNQLKQGMELEKLKDLVAEQHKALQAGDERLVASMERLLPELLQKHLPVKA